MIKKYPRVLFLACVCVAFLASAFARADDDEPLGVGMSPPPVQIIKFIKGSAPDMGTDTGCVLVVFMNLDDEKASLTSAMNALQKEMGAKGLQILVVSKSKDEDVDKAFSKAEKAGMLFALGADDSENTWRAWVDASKKDKFPLGFIVSRGKIVWLGNPLDATLPGILRKSVVGKYDPKLLKKAQPMLEAARKSLQVGNTQEAYKHFDEAIELDPAFFSDIVLERYKATLKNETDEKVASEWILKLVKKGGGIYVQNEIVMAIVKDPEIQKRDFESALVIADSMVGKNPTIGLQAKALVCAAQKDWPQAIDLQTDAWMGAEMADKPMAKQRLEEYRAAAKIQSGKKP